MSIFPGEEKIVLLGDIELRCIFSIFPGDRVGVKSCAEQTAGDDNAAAQPTHHNINDDDNQGYECDDDDMTLLTSTSRSRCFIYDH